MQKIENLHTTPEEMREIPENEINKERAADAGQELANYFSGLSNKELKEAIEKIDPESLDDDALAVLNDKLQTEIGKRTPLPVGGRGDNGNGELSY